jgi:hypothetical protein
MFVSIDGALNVKSAFEFKTIAMGVWPQIHCRDMRPKSGQVFFKVSTQNSIRWNFFLSQVDVLFNYQRSTNKRLEWADRNQVSFVLTSFDGQRRYGSFTFVEPSSVQTFK